MTRKVSLLFALVLAAICTTVGAAQIAEGDYYVVGKDSSKALTAIQDRNGNVVLGQSDRKANDSGQLWTFVRAGKGGGTDL